MAQLTNSERLVKLETLMTQVLTEIKEMRTEMKTTSSLFVSVDKYVEDMEEIRTELAEINSKRWVHNTLSAILGAILTLLLSYFITNVGK